MEDEPAPYSPQLRAVLQDLDREVRQFDLRLLEAGLTDDVRGLCDRLYDLEAESAAQRAEISRLHSRLHRLEDQVHQGRGWLLHLSDRTTALEDATQKLAIKVRSLVTLLRETLSETEAFEPRSKLRRRWLHQAHCAPVTPPLPMENSPGASSGDQSWQLIEQNQPVPENASFHGWPSETSTFLLMPLQSTPPRPSLPATPKAPTWRAPRVCLRYNSPFQVGRNGRQPTVARLRPCAPFPTPRQAPKAVPVQQSTSQIFPTAKALPHFQDASAYAVYPMQQPSPVQVSLSLATPRPVQPSTTALRAPSELHPPAFREPIAGLVTSKDNHQACDERNKVLFDQLCASHGAYSEVLQQLSGSREGTVIKSRLLSKVSDTTAARYLRSVQLFFCAFEELGGNMESIDQGLFLDAFFALSRGSETGPLSNSINVLKALRWYKKLLSLACLPDLYGTAFSLLSNPSGQEKRESIPLPLSFVAFLERTLLSGTASLMDTIWAGSFLVAIGASLRFADAQHVRWSSLSVSHFTLRGICYRTRTTKGGCPFGLLSFGPFSSSEEWGLTWLPRWLGALDKVWSDLRSRFGAQPEPDCMFFLLSDAGFAPATYSQALQKLRHWLTLSGIEQHQASQYTLHSLKTTFLSWMSQLSIPLASRFLQGHHKTPGSAQLYSRDDVWPALRAQLLLWRSIHSGFRPARPQHRGGQSPLAEPPFETAGFQWDAFIPALRCFSLGSDFQSFLALEQQDGELREARESCSTITRSGPKLPSCVRARAQVDHFEDSDADDAGPARPSAMVVPTLEVDPTWQDAKSEGLSVSHEEQPLEAPSFQTSRTNCREVRYLLGASGVAHLSISHPGSRMTCLACKDAQCQLMKHNPALLPAWVMAKLSPDYVFSLLKSMNEAERAHFLKRMEGDPLLPSTTPAPALAAAPSEQPASSTVIDPIGDSIAAEDYGPPAASTSSPSPAAPTLEAPAEPKAATGGESAPTGATPAAQGEEANAEATGDGVTNAKRWQREPEVKEPPPRPPSSPALASNTPKAGVPLLKSKSMATPAPPASVVTTPPAATPSAPPASKAPPPPLVEEGTTGGSSGNTGQQPPASTPQREIAPLLASDAPASRLGHTIYDSEGRATLQLVQLWACRRQCSQCAQGHCQATFSDRSNSFHVNHLCRDCKRSRGRERQEATSQWNHGQDEWGQSQTAWEDSPAWSSWNWSGRAWQHHPLELGFRKPVISSTASRLENRRQAMTIASKYASAFDSLRNMKSLVSPAWVKHSSLPLGGLSRCLATGHRPTPESSSHPALHQTLIPLRSLDMSDFSQFVSDCNVPPAVASLLSEFDTALYARACTTSSELEELITHFMTEAAVTEAAERFITKASLRLLFSKCRQAEGMASLEATPSSALPLGEAPSTAVPTAPAAVPLSSSWQEAWPAKLSGERTAALRKRFEEDYPTELLDAESFPSARLLALTNKMLSEKEVRWIPWKYRLSARAQEDSLLIRPKKQARFDIAEFFFDEAPTRDIHEGPASFSFVTQLLSLAANAIALCQGAHLGSLKLYNKKFTRICFTKYEASANLRGPTTMEAQAADRRCWEIIADLVNVHHWKLDDALHEVAEVRSDLHSLLAPRPFVPKPKHDPDNSWKAGAKGNGRGGKGGGRGGKGRDGKGEKGERFERGGKGGKGKDNKQATPPGKWLSTIFMVGKRQTLCMRYQSGQCKDPATCRYVHRCAETHFSDQRDIAEEVTVVPLSVPAQPSGSAGATSALPKAGAPVSIASLAISEGSLDFATCLELLAQYFSIPFIDAAGPTDNAIDASGAYFNLGAFSFDNGTRSGIFQRTEQFSDVLRFLNAFMQLQFPGAPWSSLCVSHNVRTRLHTDAGNASGTLNHTVSLGNFSGGEIWISPALDPSAANIPAPLEASSEAHRAEDASKGELRDTWHSPLSFSCESLHCTMPIQGDRWVLTAYTCRNLHSFDMKSLAHLRSLGFPLPPVPTTLPQAVPSAPKDNTHVEIFLDICCGASHPLTTAISSCGIICLPIDLLGEEQLDLLHDDTYDHLLRLCFSGIVRFAHGSPPCKEYSRLKLRPGGPAAIRSPEHLNGLPGNTASQQERVVSSQKLLYRCVCLLRAAFNSGAHVSLEQPTNAMSWLEPFVQDMLAEIQASLVNIPACSVGQDIAKSWLFACSFDDMQALAGTCSHSEGHPSVAGVRDELGNFLSQRTAEYPAQLANRFAQQAAQLFSSRRPSHSVPSCSLAFALSSIPKKPRAATTTASQDGGGIYSLPDWSMGPRYQSDSLHALRKEWQSWLLSHRIPLRLQQHVAAGSNSPLFSEEETSWLRGSFKRFSDAHSPAQDWDFSVKEGQPYCLSALERLSTLLGDKDTTLFPALQKGVPTGFDGDIPRSHTLRPRSIHTYLDDKLRFTGTPPGTSISEGSTLLSARHKTLHSKNDLALVPVSTKRMWLRVTDPTSSKRRLSEASRETLSFFAHLSSREWRPRPLRPPPTSSVESAADAFGKGNDCGVGGWLRLPGGRLLWFAHRYTVQDFLELGLPMQPDANLDISSYETLAQCYVLLAFWKAHGSGRLALTLPALSDNSGAESVCNKLYTSKVPLNLFVRKLSMWSSITGVTLDCSHIAGEKNHDADLLSRWDGCTALPDKFLPSNRIELYLSEFWQIRFQVKLFPADTFLKWQLPSATSLGPTNRGSNKRK
ncbi:unnamed protein product [Symbiodinium sp. CCMP2592]|nr:unnamed protein product [Symbiodinium sp. CCMP2592]